MANKYKHLRESKPRKKSIHSFIRGCVSKKKLSASIADLIIEKERDNKTLFKYYCGACDAYHLTKKPQVVKS